MKVYATKPTFLDEDPSKMPNKKYSIYDRNKWIHTNSTSFSPKDVEDKVEKDVPNDLVVQGFLRTGQLVEVNAKKKSKAKKTETPKAETPKVKEGDTTRGKR